jgi:SAM-dependent methyltransferase
VHEVGCGEGFLARLLATDGYQVRGSDLSPATIAEARRRSADITPPIAFQVADLYRLDPGRDAAELIFCCEVLEHLPDPSRVLDVLAQLARPHLIANVPREPLWRILNLARGRYWSDLGNTPGHLQLVGAQLHGRTQIAKYLPGNVFHLLGRQVVGRQLGYGPGPLGPRLAG